MYAFLLSTGVIVVFAAWTLRGDKARPALSGLGNAFETGMRLTPMRSASTARTAPLSPFVRELAREGAY